MRAEAPLLPEEKPFNPCPMRITDGDFAYDITATKWAYRAAHNILTEVLAPNFAITSRGSSNSDTYASALFVMRHPVQNAIVNINFNPVVISDFFTRHISKGKHFNPIEGLLYYPEYNNLPAEERIMFIRRNMDALYVHELDHLENHSSEEWKKQYIKNEMKDNKIRLINMAQLLMQFTNLYAGLKEVTTVHDQSLPYLISRHTAIALLFYFEAERCKRKVRKEDYLDDPWEVKARQKVKDMVEKGEYPGYFDVELAK